MQPVCIHLPTWLVAMATYISVVFLVLLEHLDAQLRQVHHVVQTLFAGSRILAVTLCTIKQGS